MKDIVYSEYSNTTWKTLRFPRVVFNISLPTRRKNFRIIEFIFLRFLPTLCTCLDIDHILLRSIYLAAPLQAIAFRLTTLRDSWNPHSADNESKHHITNIQYVHKVYHCLHIIINIFLKRNEKAVFSIWQFGLQILTVQSERLACWAQIIDPNILAKN